MDKILIILSFVLLTSCGPKELTSDQLVERQGVHYEVNSTTPFTGVVVDYHDNGQLKLERNYKAGKPDGPLEAFYENGQLHWRENTKDGKREGLLEYYNENG